MNNFENYRPAYQKLRNNIGLVRQLFFHHVPSVLAYSQIAIVNLFRKHFKTGEQRVRTRTYSETPQRVSIYTIGNY